LADTANLELARQGGLVPFSQGQLLTAADVQRAQTLGLATLHHWLMVLFYDQQRETPLSGFPEESDHCLVTATGNLAGEVAPGIGYVLDSSVLDPAGDAWDHGAFQPIVVDVAEPFTLAAHNATNPRWDIISIGPARLNDENGTRRVKNPTTLVESSQSVPLRRRYSFEVTVTQGTPAASPVEPVVPTGHVKIARAEVPATSGATVFRDTRPLVQLGGLLKGHPAKEYARNFIPNPSSAPNALQVTASSPTSLVLQVAEGRAMIRGISRWYQKQTVTLSAAHATNPRIDLVCALENGTVAVTAGTPAGSPAVPSQPANSIALAQVAVAALDTTITNSNITDLRSSYLLDTEWVSGRRRPYGNEQFDDYVLNHSKLSVPEVFVSVGAATFPDRPQTAELPIELFLLDGETEYTGPFGEHACAFEVAVRSLDDDGVLGAAFAGATADFTSAARKTYKAVYDPTYTPLTILLAVYFMPDTGVPEDVNEDGAASSGEHHVFWMEERTGTLKMELATTTSTGSYVFMVTVRPIGRPGGFRRRIVTFTIP
jgi:hypothetical protein